MSRVRLGLLASTALIVLGGQSAEAAPPVPYDWTGFYAGGNLGYSWGNLNTTTSISPFFYDPFFYNFPGGAISNQLHPDGWIGGFQIGYNRRIAPQWVAGIEGDWQWSGETSSRHSSFGGINDPTCSFEFCNFTNTTDITAKLSWFATLRGRLGFLVLNDDVLLYGTGGLAFGEVTVSGVNTATLLAIIPGVVTFPAPFQTPFSYSGISPGYVIGAGAEGRVGTSRWTWKVEYLYMDLASIGGGSFGLNPVITVNSGRFTDNILRVGFNYQFGAAPPP
jgi:outer membrane immunogenic protein